MTYLKRDMHCAQAYVDLDDPRTVAWVQEIGAILEQSGVVSAGWVSEVLNG